MSEIEYTLGVCKELQSVNVGETGVKVEDMKVLRRMFGEIQFLVETLKKPIEMPTNLLEITEEVLHE